MSGRKDRLCGQMGVNRMHGTCGCTMEPPAARLYAVDPVGVATISPSPCARGRGGRGGTGWVGERAPGPL